MYKLKISLCGAPQELLIEPLLFSIHISDEEKKKKTWTSTQDFIKTYLYVFRLRYFSISFYNEMNANVLLDVILIIIFVPSLRSPLQRQL